MDLNPLNTVLSPIFHLLVLLGAHPVHHISRIRVKVDRKGVLSRSERRW